MGTQAPPRSVASSARLGASPLRIAFVGSPVWLDGCCPPQSTRTLAPTRILVDGRTRLERLAAEVALARPQVTVVFDPPDLPVELVTELPGVTLGVLVEREAVVGSECLGAFDRLVSFWPALTGTTVGESEIWRAIPPPVNDLLFGDVRPLHRRPRAMTIGRSTTFREQMLLPAKHHHDLLQVIHGVSGEALVELLREHDVGVYFPPEPGGDFGLQVGIHLAAGQLLITEALAPSHGLERNIDYLQLDTAEGLVWLLDRLTRFPEMYQRIRIRGRLKAEQYRASRLFARIAHDLIADVAAFGSRRTLDSG